MGDAGGDDAADAAKLDAADKTTSDGKVVCENCDTNTQASETETETDSANTATTLMEIESSVHASMSRCKGDYCEAAYHYAFDLYKLHITMLNTTSMISVQTKKSLLSSALLFPNLLNVK